MSEALPKDRTGKYDFIQFLGSGGAGRVYQVNQKSLKDTPRALKLLTPSDISKKEDFQETFEKEILHLTKLSHTNIIKILDTGSIEESQYFVMELADGQLTNAIEAISTREELLKLLNQLFEGLAYIHARGMMHGDIKPPNLLFIRTEDGKIEAKIGDLGVSKLFPLVIDGIITENFSRPKNKYTRLWGTYQYAAPEVRDRESMDRDELKKISAMLDLYSLGVALAEILSTDEFTQNASQTVIERLLSNLRPKIKECLSESELAYLKRFILNLTTEDDSKRYKSIKDAHQALQRLDARYVGFSAMPELTGIGCTNEIVHGGNYIKLSDRTLKWINHPAFNRLHHLNQLGFLYTVYPGARHSRLAHSLEVFELGRKVILNLLNDDAFRFYVSEDDITTFLATCLLHDIGHYPLAHILEEDRIFGRADNHQAMVNYFLDSDFGTESLRKTLINDGIDIDMMVRLITKASTEKEGEAILKQLINGDVDIDKMAYLQHDSIATSVNYGRGVDVEGLLDSFIILTPSNHNVKVPELGIRKRGISAAESVIFNRYQMYTRVYWHRTNRAIISMIHYVIENLHSQKVVDFNIYLEENKDKSDWEALRWLQNKINTELVGNINPITKREISSPLPSILNGKRTFHKRLITFGGHETETALGQAQDVVMRMNRTQLEALRGELIDIIENYTKVTDIKDDELLFDIPKKSLQSNTTFLRVVDDRTKELTWLSHSSIIVNSVSQQYKTIANRCRIFISARLDEYVRKNHVIYNKVVNAVLNTEL